MRHALTVVTDPATGKVYPVPAGGAEDDATDDATGDVTTVDGGDNDDSDTDGADQLGEPGKQALQRMKDERKQLRADLKAYKELGKSPDAIKELLAAQRKALKDDKPDDAPDADAIRAEVEGEIHKKYSRDRALDKLEAKAARKFQNPDLARKLLADQADDFLDDKGNPNVEAITEALDELLSDEPYLAVQDGKRFQGDADSGTRNGSKPAQLTRTDLAGMSPEQINKAKADGRLDALLGRT